MANPTTAQLSGRLIGNTTAAIPHQHPPLELSWAVPVGILLALVIFIVVFGNILVIIAVFTTRSLRNVTCNYYIVSLAVADLLLGVLVLPFSSAKEILSSWPFPGVFCVIWLSTDVLSCTASILNLLCISVDRYLAISRPLHYHNYSSPRFVFIMIGTAWILAFLISFAPIFGFDTSGDKADQCKVAASGLFWTLYRFDASIIPYILTLKAKEWRKASYWPSSKSIFNMTLFKQPKHNRDNDIPGNSAAGSFFLPLSIMLFLYYRIYLVAAKHSKFMKEERERYASFAQQQQEFDCHNRNLSLDQGSEPIIGDHRVSRVTIVSNGTPLTEYHGFPKDSLVQVQGKKSGLMKKLRRLSKDKKAAKTLFIVMACFILCWFPFFTIYLIDGVCKEVCSINEWIFKIFFWLGYCNSMLNPVIYTATSHDFRTAFRKILHCNGPSSEHSQFAGDTDYRTTVTTAARPTTGNGRLSAPPPVTAAAAANTTTTNNQRHSSSSIASHLINKTRGPALDSPLLNRFPAVGQNYTLVESRQHENGLSRRKTSEEAGGGGGGGAAGEQSREIVNASLQSHCDLSLERTSGPNDSSIKASHKRMDDGVTPTRCCGAGTSTMPSVTETFAHCPYDKSEGGPAPPVDLLHKNGGPVFAMPGWEKVKVKAKQMVSAFSDNRKIRHSERSPTNGTVVVDGAQFCSATEMTDAGVTTSDMDVSEKCVQTSISFQNLGAI